MILNTDYRTNSPMCWECVGKQIPNCDDNGPHHFIQRVK